ncbi:MAG: septum formation initiator family protein [Rhizobiaceae bacterium]|nr:septum formation initiator family protein [Rhizobiaceae bacterium]
MWTRHHKQRNTGRLIVPVIASAFLAYFGYHAFQGAYGINAKHRLEERVTILKAELDQLVVEREALETKLILINDGSIERDMLDEQARRALDLVRDDEVVIDLDQ